MNRNFYALLLTPLLFVACDKQPKIEPKETKEPVAVTKSVTEPTKAIATKAVETTVNGVKYVKKPLVQEEGLLHIKSYMNTLKPTLESAIKGDNSFLTAVGVCSSMAMDMTDEYNQMTANNPKIRRTALKYRNQKNKPDATDTTVMKALSAKLDFTPVTVEMGDHYRVYKPLPTQKACLSCHGDSSKVSKKVLDMTKRKYPKDLAMGHIEGDFKGVIVAEIRR